MKSEPAGPPAVHAHREVMAGADPGGDSSLRSYQALKLDVADLTRAFVALARESGDRRSERAGRELLTRLAGDRLDLAVLGQFSRGKSTLMNAIMGRAYLPMGARPTTSVVTSVHHGDRPRALVHRRGHPLPLEVPIDTLTDHVTRVEERSSEVTRVDVELPAEVLRLGFNFVDTPGIGSAITTGTPPRGAQGGVVVHQLGPAPGDTLADRDGLACVTRRAGRVTAGIRDGPAAAQRSGRLNQKRLAPGRDSTPTRPPARSTNCLTMARPIPAPPRFRSRDFSTR